MSRSRDNAEIRTENINIANIYKVDIQIVDRFYRAIDDNNVEIMLDLVDEYQAVIDVERIIEDRELTNYCCTPIIYACGRPNVKLEMVTALIMAGANISKRDTRGYNAFHADANMGFRYGKDMAIYYMNYKVQIENLSIDEAGRQIDKEMQTVDNIGRTLMHHVGNFLRDDLVSFYKKFGLDVNQKGVSGATPAHYAVDAAHRNVEASARARSKATMGLQHSNIRISSAKIAEFNQIQLELDKEYDVIRLNKGGTLSDRGFNLILKMSQDPALQYALDNQLKERLSIKVPAEQETIVALSFNTLKSLVDNGADLSIRDSQNQTPIDSFPHATKILLQRDQAVNGVERASSHRERAAAKNQGSCCSIQ